MKPNYGVINLWNTFGNQADFQRHINAHPEDMTDPEELIQYIKDMVLALEDELHEMLQEIGWKPWATSRHINREGMKSELVDVFQFFMNLCFAAGMDSNELLMRHSEKLRVNYKRAEDGYDGKSTKCAWCGRALDDSYVSCELTVTGAMQGTSFCASKQITHNDGFFTQEELRHKNERQA